MIPAVKYIEKIMAAYINFYVFNVVFYVLFCLYVFADDTLHFFDTCKLIQIVLILFEKYVIKIFF